MAKLSGFSKKLLTIKNLAVITLKTQFESLFRCFRAEAIEIFDVLENWYESVKQQTFEY